VKYGVKIQLSENDQDWLWLTIGDSKFQLEPMLFEEREDAEEYALKVWGPNAKVEVYGESKNTF
jgi:hypothetical protein